MSDRELLELAAKAAQMEVVTWSNCQAGGFLKRVSETESGKFWNPLTDDGDAFRLAVKLDLSIITSWGFDGKPSGSVGAMLGSTDDLRLTSTKHNGDPRAAWRRTIVIAAAEIGKHTKC
jgi:hypothetical protein